MPDRNTNEQAAPARVTTARVTTPQEDQLAYATLQGLLADEPRLVPVTLETYGDWCPTVMVVAMAYGVEGAPAAQWFCGELAARDEQLRTLLAADPAPPAPVPGEQSGPQAGPQPGTDDDPDRDPWPNMLDAALGVPVWAGRPAILPPYLPVGVSLLCGRTGAGKTGLALQWAVEVAGERNHEHKGVREGVLYVAGAARQARILRRLRRLQTACGLPLQVACDWPLLQDGGLTRLADALLVHRVVILDDLRCALGLQDGAAPRPTVTQVSQVLARLHALAMATRSAILMIDERLYPPPLGSEYAKAQTISDDSEEIDAIDDFVDLDAIDDVVGAALYGADFAGQLENVLTLTRRPGATHGLLTSPELAQPVVVRIPGGDPKRGSSKQGPSKQGAGRRGTGPAALRPAVPPRTKCPQRRPTVPGEAGR